MTDQWTAPEFREVSVCGECTAYSGADANTSAPNEPARLPPPAAGAEAPSPDGNDA
jgi:hypothetical protein